MKKTGSLVIAAMLLASASAFATGTAPVNPAAGGGAFASGQSRGGMSHGNAQNMSLEQMRQVMHERVQKLNGMTEDQWSKLQQKAAQGGHTKISNLSLAQAQQEAQKFETKLDSMTPEQWDAFKARKQGAAGGGFKRGGGASSRLPDDGN